MLIVKLLIKNIGIIAINITHIIQQIKNLKMNFLLNKPYSYPGFENNCGLKKEEGFIMNYLFYI